MVKETVGRNEINMNNNNIGINITRHGRNIKNIKNPIYVGYSLDETNEISLCVEEHCLDCNYNPTIEDVIIHETLHLVIHKIEGKDRYDFESAYWMLDNLCYSKSHGGLGFGLTLKKFRRIKK